MDPEFADFIPVFVGEAKDRLERLTSLLPRAEGDTQAAAEMKRELHTLKGSGRMLHLSPLAELCHAAEGLLQAPQPGKVPLLTLVIDRLSIMVEEISKMHDPTPDDRLLEQLAAAKGTPAATPASAPFPTPQPAATHTISSQNPPSTSTSGDDIRVDASAVDTMTDRATRLRILSLHSAQFLQRLHELAQLAAQGVHENEPRQILAVLSASLRRVAIELEAEQMRVQRTADTNLDALLALQLQPMRSFLQKIARHARELARSMGREVEIEIVGEDTRLDRRICRLLEDALVHLVRNAVDHGIEAPELREKAGKSRIGRIRIVATASGNRVFLAISDDGAGVDAVKVIDAALARGFIDKAQAEGMSASDAIRLLFTPGFSMRKIISEISGRGIGLDVVANAAAHVGGDVRVETNLGAGTTVTIEVPVSRRGEDVLLLRAGAVLLAYPANAVKRIDLIKTADVIERDGRLLVQLDGKLIPFVSLANTIGETPATWQLLLQGEYSGRPVTLAVDSLEGNEEVLVRPMARVSGETTLYEGVALLSSGQPVAVLSPKSITQKEVGGRVRVVQAKPKTRRLRILLVDDSMVTREMERRLLEDSGFEVTAAADAQEALEKLAEATFDCLVTDIEMPGIDGFEFTRRIRTIPHIAHLPVVVVSTRDRPEDRLHGLEAGADAYITKQSLDATEMAAVVRRLVGR